MPDSSSPARILFADITPARLEPPLSLGAKYERLLGRLNLKERVAKKRVGIKMHFGGGYGFTTVHPYFVRQLVHALKEAGASSIKAMDNDPESGIARGYTREVLGCDVVSTFGASGRYLHRQPIGFKTLDEVEFGGEATDCDFFIDFSHVKGHGACGFGGALKNIAMGVVPPGSRKKLHELEGGFAYHADTCTYCQKCFKECPNHAISLDEEKKKINVFYHHCTFCQHCVMICPQRAFEVTNRTFEDFSQGMALVTAKFLQRFAPENLLFINVLLNITVFCDCWGMSTAALVPDIGILASDDIAAIETASLDMIKAENLLPNGLPKDRTLVKGAHLFEQVHGKNPYVMVKYLREVYGGAEKYAIEEVL